MSSRARDLLTALVLHAGIYRLARWLNRRRLLVLTYHGVLSRPGGGFLNRNCVSVEEFERQVAFLERHYRLLTLEQALDGIAGRRPLPLYGALITFDDGFRNNVELAAPVLRRHGAPAVLFVTTGMLDRPGTLPWVEQISAALVLTPARTLDLDFQGRERRFALDTPADRLRACEELRHDLKRAPSPERERVTAAIERQCPIPPGALDPERFDFMDWDEARAAASGGLAIGSHTVRHLCVSTLDDSELAAEVAGSKRRIEDELGRPCVALSYPDGTADSYGPRDQEALRASGFQGAFTQIPGYNEVGADLLALKRFNVPGGAAGFSAFVLTLVGARRAARRLWSKGISLPREGDGSAEIKREVGQHFGTLAGQYHHLNYEAAVRRGKYPDIHMRHRHILGMLDGRACTRALEIGVGGGELLTELRRRGHDVVGVDLAPEMAAAAGARAASEVGGPPPKVAAADLERLCFRSESFDLVVAAGVIEYLPSPGPALAEIARVLRPGGTAIVSIRNRLSLSRPVVALRDLLESYSMTGPAVRAAMSFFRGSTRRRPDTGPVFARRDLPWRFGREMRRHGLAPVDRAFYHFSIFPGSLERRFPRFCIGAGMRLEAACRTPVGYLGRGCIFLARKEARPKAP